MVQGITQGVASKRNQRAKLKSNSLPTSDLKWGCVFIEEGVGRGITWEYSLFLGRGADRAGMESTQLEACREAGQAGGRAPRPEGSQRGRSGRAIGREGGRERRPEGAREPA